MCSSLGPVAINNNLETTVRPQTFSDVAFALLFFALKDREQTDNGLLDENVRKKEVGIPAPIDSTSVTISKRFETFCFKLPKDELANDLFKNLVSPEQKIMNSIQAKSQKQPVLNVGITTSVAFVKHLNNEKVTFFFGFFRAGNVNSITYKFIALGE